MKPKQCDIQHTKVHKICLREGECRTYKRVEHINCLHYCEHTLCIFEEEKLVINFVGEMF